MFGWSLTQEGGISDDNNVALVTHPETGVVVIVCSGDIQTGRITGDQPKSRRAKGDIFLARFEMVSPGLFGDTEAVTRLIAADDAKVWLLVHYHTREFGEEVLRAELSRPREAKDGVITRWAERIILNVPLGDAIEPAATSNDDGPVATPQRDHQDIV